MLLTYMDSQRPSWVIGTQVLLANFGMSSFNYKTLSSILAPLIICKRTGKPKWLNHMLEMYLHCFTSCTPTARVKWLPWVKYVYNTNIHSSTGQSPYEVVYGRKSPSLLSYVQGTSKVEAVAQTLTVKNQLIK